MAYMYDLTKLVELTDQKRVVKVLGVDFNGKEFDGAPLALVGDHQNTNYEVPEWLIDAEKGKMLFCEARGQTDYAWFGVKDDYYNVTWAGPGDYIVAMPKKHKGHQLLVIPGEFFDMIFPTTIAKRDPK